MVGRRSVSLGGKLERITSAYANAYESHLPAAWYQTRDPSFLRLLHDTKPALTRRSEPSRVFLQKQGTHYDEREAGAAPWISGGTRLRTPSRVLPSDSSELLCACVCVFVSNQKGEELQLRQRNLIWESIAQRHQRLRWKARCLQRSRNQVVGLFVGCCCCCFRRTSSSSHPLVSCSDSAPLALSW